MAARASGGITVLHVEDDPGFADLAVDMLEMVAEDIEVVTATDADTALARLDDEPVDCVVSDHDMPGRSGLELLEAVRKKYPSLPFILFTGKGSEEIASRAITAGVSDYLQKDSGRDCYEILAKRVRDAVDRYRSEERYHNLIDTAPVPIVLFGPERRLRYANDAAVEFLDAPTEESLLDTAMTEFLHPDDRERALGRFEKYVAQGDPAPETEFRVRTVDGATKRAIIATAPGFYRGERVAQVVVRTTPD